MGAAREGARVDRGGVALPVYRRAAEQTPARHLQGSPRAPQPLPAQRTRGRGDEPRLAAERVPVSRVPHETVP